MVYQAQPIELINGNGESACSSLNLYLFNGRERHTTKGEKKEKGEVFFVLKQCSFRALTRSTDGRPKFFSRFSFKIFCFLIFFSICSFSCPLFVPLLALSSPSPFFLPCPPSPPPFLPSPPRGSSSVSRPGYPPGPPPRPTAWDVLPSSSTARFPRGNGAGRYVERAARPTGRGRERERERGTLSKVSL